MKKSILIILVSCFIIGKTAGQDSRWKTTDRVPFITECVKAAKAGMSEDSAKFYCYCMLVKLEVKYPDPNDAGLITEETLNSPEFKKMINDCLGGYWKTEDRNDFMSSCIGAAKDGMGEEKARSYCECMMFKIEYRYPSYSEANKITKQTLETPEWKKMIQTCLE